MNKPTLLFLACLAAIVSIARAADSRQQPNFLFIAVDDLKPVLGRLGEEPNNFLSELYPDPAKRAEIRRVLSPAMDALAAQGIDFRRTYCPAPLCNPSRTATLTGIATRQNGIYINADNFRQSDKPYVRDAITLPQNLRNHGYYVAGTGKIFHMSRVLTDASGRVLKDWPDSEHSWDVWINGEGDGADHGTFTLSPWSLNDRLFKFGTTSTAFKDMDDYRKADLIGRALEQGRVTVIDPTGNVRKTIALPRDRPFFLACGIFRPHLPFVVPKEFVDRFNPDDIQITRDYYNATVDDIRDLAPGGRRWTERPRDDGEPGVGRFSDMLRAGRKRDPKDGDLKAWRDMIRHYLAAVSFADACVNRVLTALDHSPFRDNTIVVLWSDHGWDLGTKFRAGKVALWESTTACVLTVRFPQPTDRQRGAVCRAFVSLQDLYPSLCALAHVPAPDYVAGRDLAPLFADPAAAWDEIPITTQGARSHALRDPGYRYIRYADDPKNAELYDEQADPREHINRIDDPALADARRRFDQLLENEISAGPFPYDVGRPGMDYDADAPGRRRPEGDK